METKEIWDNFGNELYFFILKRVKDKNATNDIFQNTFMKIHDNLSNLRKGEKIKGWIFQIARNEIANHFNKESIYVDKITVNKEVPSSKYKNICCFDKFINDLPEIYREVIELVYIKGCKQNDAANQLEISLENVKARIRRAKNILKKKFNECCKYEIDENGKLTGDSDCSICNTI
ncbi:sigma-70 family RNA polymerase sigma factor [Salegentibacter sp. F14]